MNGRASTPVDRWRRQKLLAIPILVLVLAAMLYRNFHSSTALPPSVPPVRAVQAAEVGPSAVLANTTLKSDAKPWPKFELREIIAKNPFGPWFSADAKTAPAPGQTNSAPNTVGNSSDSDEAANASGQTVVELTEKVQALYHDAAGTAAIVDSHIIRPGDRLDDGSQVLKVTDDGITLMQRQ